MVMKVVLEKLDEVDEGLREHYKEVAGVDGKPATYVLDLDGFDHIPGVKSLRGENASWRTKLRDAESKYGKFAAFKDMDPTEILQKLDRISELEALAGGKLDDKKIDEIVEGRIKTKLSPVERERDTLKTQNADLTRQLGEFTAKEKTRMITDSVRAAATELKMQPEAFEDAIILAERLFEVDEDGKVIVKDKVGYTPGIDAKSWLTDMQAKKPHWWGPSTGGGSRGGFGPQGGNGANPFSHEHWNVTAQGKLVREDPKRADQMAANAGTTVGGKRPQPKK